MSGTVALVSLYVDMAAKSSHQQIIYHWDLHIGEHLECQD